MKELNVVAREIKADPAKLKPRAQRSWVEVNDMVKGLKPKVVVEFDYPPEVERKEFRMVVIGAGHRYWGKGRVATKTEGGKLWVWLREGKGSS